MPPSPSSRPDQQEKKLNDAVKASLQTSWQAVVANSPDLTEIGELQRQAQWRLDFVAAENSMGFHASQELARILTESIDLSRQAEVRAVMLLGGKAPAIYPTPRRRTFQSPVHPTPRPAIAESTDAHRRTPIRALPFRCASFLPPPQNLNLCNPPNAPFLLRCSSHGAQLPWLCESSIQRSAAGDAHSPQLDRAGGHRHVRPHRSRVHPQSGAGAELAYLLWLASSKRFQRFVDGARAADKRDRERVDSMIASLPAPAGATL